MNAIKVALKDAEKVKKELQIKKLYNKKYIPLKKKNYIYLPINKAKFDKFDIVNIKLEISKKQNYKEAFKQKIPKKYVSYLPSSFDTIGDIIIIEIKPELKKYEKKIGEILLNNNKNIKTIFKKKDIYSGEFRTRPLKYLCGVEKKETIYKENNALLKLNVEKVYFSPRTSSERKRIYKQIKNDEDVLVMFAGCGPYPITISKNSNVKQIFGIEKNPVAFDYFIENIKLNKCKNITAIFGDIIKEIPKIQVKFDRIIMPLPKNASDFLKFAFVVSKKGTTIHLYDFQHENEINLVKHKIKRKAKKANIKYKIIKIVKCGQYSPGKFRICIDFKII